MIPVSLRLRNFMSYTEGHGVLQLEGIHVAVIAGDNGHGKSALLDAMTWALWGRARARAVDDLIHHGACEMEVELEFRVEEQQYRVIRKRERRGRGQSLSDLQFAISSGGGYVSLTEKSIGDTERAVRGAVGMTYETFASSSFIQQGKADTFTAAAPAERKRVLADILQLGAYDDLEVQARASHRECESQLVAERARAAEWEEDLKRKPELVAQSEGLRLEISLLEVRASELESQDQVARERHAASEAAASALEEIEKGVARTQVERIRQDGAAQEARRQIESAQAILARAESIQRRSADLSTKRAELATIEEKLHAYVDASRAYDQAEAVIQGEQRSLETRLSSLARMASEQRHRAEEVPRLQQARATVISALGELPPLLAQRNALAERLATEREDASGRRAVKQQLRTRMEAVRGRLNELDGLASCPVCQRPMHASHKNTLRASYESEGLEMKAQFREHERTCRLLDEQVLAGRQDAQALDLRISDLQQQERALGALEASLQQASDAGQQAATLQVDVDQVQAALLAETFAKEARQQRGRALTRLAALAYDREEHAALRAAIADLGDAERDQTELSEAVLRRDHAGQRLEDATATLERLERELRVDGDRREELRVESAKAAPRRQALAGIEKELADVREGRDAARDALAQAQGWVDHCAFLEKRLRESVIRQDTGMREAGIFSDLANAFGRRGVQAMLIESAVPEIEDEANRLLAHMTDGRMRVGLDMQRETKTGGGVIETLDIRIADELGTRGYEMFSGGEAFRVNFALRIALSRLLARRAGARLRTLVIDEGFGCQDEEGRDRMIEAIHTIKCEFERILIITHLEDMRERFPVRIDVRKTPEGSTFALR